MFNIIPLAVENPLQNYIWLVVNDSLKQAIAIDPTSANLVADYIKQHDLALIAIWITHDHHDHIAGVADLKTHFPNCQLVAHAQHQFKQGVMPDKYIAEGDKFSLWHSAVTVWGLEGHKKNHVAYLLADHTETLHVFSGDILFSAGCGRCFEGTLNELYNSLQRLAGLADTTFFYPTHEFTVNNLNFSLSIMPEDKSLQTALAVAKQCRQQNKPTLPTTLAYEKKVNLFLRTHEAEVKDFIATHTNSKYDDSITAFIALRQLKDNF